MLVFMMNGWAFRCSMNGCVLVGMRLAECYWFKKGNAFRILVLLHSFVGVVVLCVCYASQRWMLDNDMWLNSVNRTQELFLMKYSDYCRDFLLPKSSNVRDMKLSSDLPLCPCIPHTLVGNVNISLEVAPPYIGDLELQHYELHPGGHWFPKFCLARHRIAVIVPFRDREIHLRHFLNIIHPFLQRQLIQYTIFVVEQAKPVVFNKASLMNAGFLEAQSLADHDCYIFHDVDMLPESDLNFYTCSKTPRHVGSHLDKWNYVLPYDELFGGVTAFTKSLFVQVNGFSNQYYGWGGEDDDMYYRMKAQNLSFIRFPGVIARFMMIKHDHDHGNPLNHERLKLLYHKDRENIYPSDGLNSVRYKVLRHEARPLYTWLELELPRHPPEFDINFSGSPSDTRVDPWIFSIFVLLSFKLAFLR